MRGTASSCMLVCRFDLVSILVAMMHVTATGLLFRAVRLCCYTGLILSASLLQLISLDQMVSCTTLLLNLRPDTGIHACTPSLIVETLDTVFPGLFQTSAQFVPLQPNMEPHVCTEFLIYMLMHVMRCMLICRWASAPSGVPLEAWACSDRPWHCGISTVCEAV